MNEDIEMQSTSESVAVTASEEERQKVVDFLQNVLDRMGFDCGVESGESGDALLLNIVGNDASAVIGHRGETLDALQYLCSLMHNGKGDGFKRVTLDAADYRAKREKALRRLAGNLESKVKRTGKQTSLEPMNPYERRVIHTALHGSKYVTTHSEGEGNNRHVVVSPLKGSAPERQDSGNILNSPNAPRKTLNFVYRSEKKRRR